MLNIVEFRCSHPVRIIHMCNHFFPSALCFDKRPWVVLNHAGKTQPFGWADAYHASLVLHSVGMNPSPHVALYISHSARRLSQYWWSQYPMFRSVKQFSGSHPSVLELMHELQASGCVPVWAMPSTHSWPHAHRARTQHLQEAWQDDPPQMVLKASSSLL